jgi:hypothetical protein
MMDWKQCGRKWSWPKLRYYTKIYLEELGNTTRNNQGSWCPSLGFNWDSPEYMSELLFLLLGEMDRVEGQVV